MLSADDRPTFFSISANDLARLWVTHVNSGIEASGKRNLVYKLSLLSRKTCEIV